MKTSQKLTLITCLQAAMLLISAQPSNADSAIWSPDPVNGNGEWHNAANWTPGGPPNSPSDTATFFLSNWTDVSIHAHGNGLPTDVYAIVFEPGASAYTITNFVDNGFNGRLRISGSGITNNSGFTQTLFGLTPIDFYNSATIQGSMVAVSAFSEFHDSSSAGNAHFVSQPSYFYQSAVFHDMSSAGNATFEGRALSVEFLDNSTAANANFTINGGAYCSFFGGSTAANGVFTIDGGANSGESGGTLRFDSASAADNATLIANGGSGGGTGGLILFANGQTLGGTARVELFGNGNLDVSCNAVYNGGGFTPSPLTLGSIEGNGAVFLGGVNLSVGSNDLSTDFSGIVQDGGTCGFTGAKLTKIGTGTLTLSGANTYTGGTLITAGTLQGAHDGVLGPGNISLAAAGATLRFQSGATNNYIADTANLSVVNGSTLNLNYTGVPDTIGSLLVAGVLQEPGVYGSAASGAPHQLPQFTGLGTIQVTTSTAVLQLTDASSRKTHGSAGDFYINLPLNGEPGVECRNSGGNHTLIFDFNNNVVSGNAAVTSGIGSVAGSPTFIGSTMAINLTGVANQQRITVTLSGVTDPSINVMPDMAVSMGVLIGDTNANRTVNASDVLQTKARLGQTITASNFRSDVNTNGSINATDTLIIKTNLGTALP